MIINDLDGYYIVFDTKNWNTELDTLVVKLHPAITIPELAQRMSGKKTVTTRTIERDIAALQAKGILKREGGRKSGKWIVVNI